MRALATLVLVCTGCTVAPPRAEGPARASRALENAAEPIAGRDFVAPIAARLGPLSGNGSGVRRVDHDPSPSSGFQSGYDAVGGLPLDGRELVGGLGSNASSGLSDPGPEMPGMMKPGAPRPPGGG
jgi:hypothetical protein